MCHSEKYYKLQRENFAKIFSKIVEEKQFVPNKKLKRKEKNSF